MKCKIFVLSSIFVFCCMICACLEQKNDQKNTTTITQKTKRSQVAISDYEKFMLKGDSALLNMNYFKAVFMYRQAAGFGANHIEAYERLILASKKSCEAGNQVHCTLTDRYQEKIGFIQQFGKADTSKWQTVNIKFVGDSLEMEWIDD